MIAKLFTCHKAAVLSWKVRSYQKSEENQKPGTRSFLCPLPSPLPLQITPTKQDQPACEVNLISSQVNVEVWEYRTNFCKKLGHELVRAVEDGIDGSIGSGGRCTCVARSQQVWDTLEGARRRKAEESLGLQTLQTEEDAQDDQGCLDPADRSTHSPLLAQVWKERAPQG